MSVFEPYPMRDTVQHFCERHLAKIKSYMTSLMVKLPLPVKCTIEERKGRKHAKLHFACQVGNCRIMPPSVTINDIFSPRSGRATTVFTRRLSTR